MYKLIVAFLDSQDVESGSDESVESPWNFSLPLGSSFHIGLWPTRVPEPNRKGPLRFIKVIPSWLPSPFDPSQNAL